MPWILKDYTSNFLDTNNISTFRDLSKPIGALGDPNRINELRERFDEMQMDDPDSACLYQTHYSCPGYVIGYYVRKNPQWMIKFQSGKFDNPNRIFNDINQEWDQCMTA